MKTWYTVTLLTVIGTVAIAHVMDIDNKTLAIFVIVIYLLAIAGVITDSYERTLEKFTKEVQKDKVL